MKMLRCLSLSAALLFAALAMPAMAEPVADMGQSYEMLQPSIDAAVIPETAMIAETANQAQPASMPMNTLRTSAPRTSIRSATFVNASPAGKTYKLRC